LQVELTAKSVQLKDLEAQIDEDRELLAASSAQCEEKDQIITDLEDQITKIQAEKDGHGEAGTK
jgi:hypothetical protein